MLLASGEGLLVLVTSIKATWVVEGVIKNKQFRNRERQA